MLEDKRLITQGKRISGRMSVQQIIACANRKQFIGSRRQVN